MSQDRVYVRRESSETGKQDVGHSRGLQVFPQPLDEVQFRTVVGQPEDLQVFFDILQISGQSLGMVRCALIHHHHDSSASAPGSTHQLLQKDLHAPSGLAGLNMVEEQAPPVAERSEDGLLAVDAGRANPLLPASEHPGSGQMRMQVEFRFVLIPQFVVGVWI